MAGGGWVVNGGVMVGGVGLRRCAANPTYSPFDSTTADGIKMLAIRLNKWTAFCCINSSINSGA